MIKPRIVYEGEFCALWSDGSMSFSDGVGFVDVISRDDAYALYLQMKALYEEKG